MINQILYFRIILFLNFIFKAYCLKQIFYLMFFLIRVKYRIIIFQHIKFCHI